MTKEELVQLGLTEEQVAKVIEDYGKNYVSKSQFNARNEELKSVKAKVSEMEGALEQAKAQPQSEMAKLRQRVEHLTKQMETAEAAKKEAEEREMKAEIRRQTVEALTAGKCTNPAEIAKILVQSVVKGDDGEYVMAGEDGVTASVKEGVERWLTENPWAVLDTQKTGSGTGGGRSGKASITQEEFAKMGYRERAELFATDPDLYQQLSESKGDL